MKKKQIYCTSISLCVKNVLKVKIEEFIDVFICIMNEIAWCNE